MGFGSRADFDIEDTISSAEGEFLVDAGSDFGEYETLDGYSMGNWGDNDDDYSFGRFKVKRPNLKKVARSTIPAPGKALSKIARPASAVKGVVKSVAQPLKAVPAVASPIATLPKPVVTPQIAKRAGFSPRAYNRAVGLRYQTLAAQYQKKHAGRVISMKAHAMRAGKLAPPAAALVPKAVQAKLLKQAENQVKNVVAQKVAKETPVRAAERPTIQMTSTPHGAGPKNEHTLMVPSVQAAVEVVKGAGQPLTAKDMTPSQVASKTVTKEFSMRHPLARFSSPMGDDADFGDDGLGIDFKAMLRDLDRKRIEEQKKLQATLQAKAKEAAGSLLSKASSRVLSDPKVQAVAAEEAKKAAAQSLAEKILAPETQQKAKMGLGVVAALGVGYLLYSKFMK